MSAPGPPSLASLPPVEDSLSGDELKSCCAALYAHPAVRWLLGGELHPGGQETTRRALELIGVGPGERVLDVASGDGASSVLAARELGCLVAGVDYSAEAVRDAQQHADAAGLCDRVGFIVGDAEALPFSDGEFDAVLCECSLCTFPDKGRAMAEIRRVLRPGGRLALCDVVVDSERIPSELDGALGAVACVGDALPHEGYEELIVGAGLRPIAVESRAEDAAALAERVHDRLRGARLLGLDRAEGAPLAAHEALGWVRAARAAIADGALGYSIFAASA